MQAICCQHLFNRNPEAELLIFWRAIKTTLAYSTFWQCCIWTISTFWNGVAAQLLQFLGSCSNFLELPIWSHLCPKRCTQWLRGGIRGQWIILREGSDRSAHLSIHPSHAGKSQLQMRPVVIMWSAGSQWSVMIGVGAKTVCTSLHQLASF